MIIKFYRVWRLGVGGKRHLNWYLASVVCFALGILVPLFAFVGNICISFIQKEFRGEWDGNAAAVGA